MHGDYLTVVGLVLEYLEVGGRTLSPVVLVGGYFEYGYTNDCDGSSLVDHIHQFYHVCPCHLCYCAVASFSVCQGTILVFYVSVVFQLA